MFGINDDNALFVIGEPDAEIQNRYNLTIEASDGYNVAIKQVYAFLCAFLKISSVAFRILFLPGIKLRSRLGIVFLNSQKIPFSKHSVREKTFLFKGKVLRVPSLKECHPEIIRPFTPSVAAFLSCQA